MSLDKVTSRSRTGLFLSYRSSIRGVLDDGEDDGEDGEEAWLGKDHTTIEVGGSSLGPRWVDRIDKVNALVEQCQGKMARLDRAHSSRLLPSFSEELERQQEEDVKRATEDITQLFREAQKEIGEIQRAVGREEREREEARARRRRAGRNDALLPLFDDSDSGNSQETVGRNVIKALASKVQDVSTAFRKKQANYLQSGWAIVCSVSHVSHLPHLQSCAVKRSRHTTFSRLQGRSL